MCTYRPYSNFPKNKVVYAHPQAPCKTRHTFVTPRHNSHVYLCHFRIVSFLLNIVVIFKDDDMYMYGLFVILVTPIHNTYVYPSYFTTASFLLNIIVIVKVVIICIPMLICIHMLNLCTSIGSPCKTRHTYITNTRVYIINKKS